MNMRKLLKYGLTGVIVIVSMISIIMYYRYSLYKKTYSSEYSYEIYIEPDIPLSDVVLYIPLPFIDTVSPVGDNIVAENLQTPENLHCNVSTTEYGVMLEITADRIDEPSTITVLLPADHSINTRDSLQNEMVLSPKYDLNQVQCDFPYPDTRETQLACFEYETLIYAEYIHGGALNIVVTLEGRNTWWILGWSGNSYRDQILARVDGESGWQPVRGKLVQGEGLYRWI